jgi:alpha/beta superfamily hydrolase
MMKLPPILQGESLTRLLQGAAVGAVATLIIGFYWGGWVLGSTADKLAKERAENAVVAAMAPVCADKFAALPDAVARKAALAKADSWKRSDEFPKELVTLAGESYPNSDLVEACYKLVVAQKAAKLN